MSLKVVCPSCRSTYTVAEELRGKKGRCRQCEVSFILEAAPAVPVRDSDAPPAAKPRSRRRRRRSVLLPLVAIGGTLITLLAVAAASLGVYVYYKSRQPAEVVGTGISDEDSAQGFSAVAPARRAFWLAALPPFHPGKVLAGEDIPAEGGPDDPTPPSPSRVIPATVPTQMSGAALQKVKRATFLLRVTMPDDQTGNGSGFLLDSTGVVVTNAHVLGMLDPGSPRPKLLEVFVNSGERGERKLRGEVLGVDRQADLALVRIPAEGLPEPLAVQSASELYETQPLWVSGFPFGEQLGKNVTVALSPVSSLRKRQGKLVSVQLQGDMRPGNSGGPVVNAQGDVVAVAVAIIPTTQINFAIPSDAVLDLARGQIALVDVGVPYEGEGGIRVPIRVLMNDPLQRVHKVAVECWIGDGDHDRSAARKSGSPPTRVELAYRSDERRGTGMLSLPSLPSGKTLWVQPTYADSQGSEQRGSAVSFHPSPPVVLRAVRLAFQPDGQERTRNLRQKTTVYLGSPAGRQFELSTHFQSVWKETMHRGKTTDPLEVQRQYTDFALTAQYNRGKPEKSPLQTELLPHLPTLSARLTLDTDFRPLREEYGSELAKADPLRSHLQTIHALTQEKLSLFAVPLPGKEVRPGTSWQPPGPRPLMVDALEFSPAQSGLMPLRFSYAGVRQEHGRELAVVLLESAALDDRAPTAPIVGNGSGLAEIDVATGHLVRLEARYQAAFTIILNRQSVPVRTQAEVLVTEGIP